MRPFICNGTSQVTVPSARKAARNARVGERRRAGWNVGRSDQVLLGKEIQTVRNPMIERYDLRQVIIAQPEVQRDIGPYLPLVLYITGPYVEAEEDFRVLR